MQQSDRQRFRPWRPLFAMGVVALQIWGTQTASAEVITVDATDDWDDAGVTMDAPAVPNVAHIGRNTAQEGQLIWTDAAGDERPIFSAPDRGSDLLEFRLAATSDSLCFFAEFAQFSGTTGDGAPLVQLALDTDRVNASGEAAFPLEADTNTADDARWEALIATRFGIERGPTELFVFAAGTPTPVLAGLADISNGANLIEGCVPFADLGLAGAPAALRVTVAVFQSDVAGDAKDVAGQSDCLETISSYGDPGSTTGTTATETADGVLDHYLDVTFSAGEVASPVLISEVLLDGDIGGNNADYIEILNPGLVAVDLSDLSIGDDPNPEGTLAGMYRFPAGATLAPKQAAVIALDATGFQAAFGSAADFAIDAGATGVPALTADPGWGGAVLTDLDATGDQVLLVDRWGTVLDAFILQAVTTWPGHADTTLTIPANSTATRTPATRDTNSIGGVDADFSATAMGVQTPGVAACLVDADCLDGLFCNGDETCPSGLCTSGSPPGDAISCTTTVCDEGVDTTDNLGTVTNTPDDTACADVLFCNGDERCAPAEMGAGLDGCVAGTDPALDVTPSFSCQRAVCDENGDEVILEPVHSRCEDILFCNGDERCAPAEMGADVDGCVAGTDPALDVTPEFACLQAVCDEGADEVTTTPINARCDDDLFCNGDERCAPAEMGADVDGCVVGTDPTLGTTPDWACERVVCDELDDAVLVEGDDARCQDGRFCNGSELCDPGLGADESGCTAGPARTLSDDRSCTQDSCAEGIDLTDNLGLVSHTPNHDRCDNGDFCDGIERCRPSSGQSDVTTGCTVGTPPDLSDGVDCTDDICDEEADEILNTANSEACPSDDPCIVGLCDVEAGCTYEVIGCSIDEACVLNGQTSPDNGCQICDISQDDAAWTTRDPGSFCSDPTCDTDGLRVDRGLCNAMGICDVPEPEDCGPGGCSSGLCVEFCLSDTDCPGSTWCLVDLGECTSANRPPTADAGADQLASELNAVTLDGRMSVDPDGDAIAFEWVQTSGPEVTLDLTVPAAPAFVAPRVQQDPIALGFSLTVDDGQLESEPATTEVTVENTTGNDAPVATIQGVQTTEARGSVVLNGRSSSDPDSDPITFLWSQAGGPAAELGTLRQDALAVRFPDVLEATTFTFGLIVNDGLLNSDLATYDVTVTPVVVAPDMGVDTGGDVGGEADMGVDVSGDTTPNAEETAPDDGCSCGVAPTRPSWPVWLVSLFGIGVLRRRVASR